MKAAKEETTGSNAVYVLVLAIYRVGYDSIAPAAILRVSTLAEPYRSLGFFFVVLILLSVRIQGQY